MKNNNNSIKGKLRNGKKKKGLITKLILLFCLFYQIDPLIFFNLLFESLYIK